MVKKKSAKKTNNKKSVKTELKQNKKVLWGVRAIVLILVVVILTVVGVGMMKSNKETEKRQGGPMYGIDIVADGEDKFIVYGKKALLIYENDGKDYEITKYFIDLGAKKIWKVFDRYNGEGELVDGDIYSAERELTDEDVVDLRDLCKQIVENEQALGEKTDDTEPYMLDIGKKKISIYDETMQSRILETMGL